MPPRTMRVSCCAFEFCRVCAAKGRQVVFGGLPSRRPGVEQVNLPMRSQQCLSRIPS